MKLRKLILYTILILVAALTGWYYIKIAGSLQRTFQDLTSSHVGIRSFHFAVVIIAVVFSAVVVHKARLNKYIVFLLVSVFTVVSVVHGRLSFYYYQSHPQYIPMKDYPECMREENYTTYMDFLTHGCHITLEGLIKTLTYKSICWILVFFVTLFILNRKNKNRKSNHELIDV